MIDPAHFALPADRIARMVDLLGNLSHAAAEVARAMAELLPPTVGEADPEPNLITTELADRHRIEQWGAPTVSPRASTPSTICASDMDWPCSG